MYLDIPQVTKCCCGASLVLGSKIISGYTLICGSLVSCAAIYEMISSKLDSSSIGVPISNKLELIYYYIGLIFLLLIGLSLIVCSVLLLYAIVKDKYSLFLPFFGIVLVVELMNVVGFIFFCVKVFTDPGLSCIFLAFIALNTGVTLYCFLVVFSYYKDVTWSSAT